MISKKLYLFSLTYFFLIIIVGTLSTFNISLPSLWQHRLRSLGINASGWKMYTRNSLIIPYARLLYFDKSNQLTKIWEFPNTMEDPLYAHPWRHLAQSFLNGNFTNTSMQEFLVGHCKDQRRTTMVRLEVASKSASCDAKDHSLLSNWREIGATSCF